MPIAIGRTLDEPNKNQFTGKFTIFLCVFFQSADEYITKYFCFIESLTLNP